MDGLVIPEWVPIAVIVLGLIISSVSAIRARRSADAAERSAKAAEDSEKSSRRSADAAERSAEASEEANQLERERMKSERYEAAIKEIADMLNTSSWQRRPIDEMLSRHPTELDKKKILISAFHRWRNPDRDLQTFLRSHGFATD